MGLLIGLNLSLLRIVYGIHKNEREKSPLRCPLLCLSASIKDLYVYTYAYVIMGIYVFWVAKFSTLLL